MRWDQELGQKVETLGKELEGGSVSELVESGEVGRLENE